MKRPEVGVVLAVFAWPVAGPPSLLGVRGDNWASVIEMWRFQLRNPKPSDSVLSEATRQMEALCRSKTAGPPVSIRRATSNEVREYGWIGWQNEQLRRSAGRVNCHPATPHFLIAARGGVRLGCFLGSGDPCLAYVVDTDGVIWKLSADLVEDRRRHVLERCELVRYLVRSCLYVHPDARELVRAVERGALDLFPAEWARAYCYPLQEKERPH